MLPSAPGMSLIMTVSVGVPREPSVHPVCSERVIGVYFLSSKITWVSSALFLLVGNRYHGPVKDREGVRQGKRPGP